MVQVNLLRIYFEVSRLIGLCNLHFDARSQRFILNHVPTVIYCIVLNVAYLLILPFALALLTGDIYECPNVGMFGVVYNVVALTKLLAMLLLVIHVWTQRRRLQMLGNDILEMLHKFRFALGNDCRKRCLWKVLLTSSRFVLLTQQLVFRDSLVRCEADSSFRRAMLPYHLAAIVYALILLLLASYVDLTVYMMQVAGNWLLANISQEVQEMLQDLKALPNRRGVPREMCQRQILPAWRKLWRRCLHLDGLLKQTVEVFQWQILINLLTIYIFNIAILFRLWTYLTFDNDFNIWKGIVYVVLFLTHHAEITMQFSVFEINRSKWLELLDRVGKLWLANFSGSKYKNSYGIILSRQLEISILFLNRKLHLHPKRVRHLHIAGLFDLSNSSVFEMSRSIITHVLVLCQIAYKIYG
ncbi:putative gustatory receptor 58c [Drosophila elegans]|uniref:putative gustatory receptor 58c n=1 Tax=Drosophila elegans TaxID=30023 RepID=UPI0007E5C7A8|nr:putative gustatory receptor 58c [Drosophila elegans]